jgi:hypothetical protein
MGATRGESFKPRGESLPLFQYTTAATPAKSSTAPTTESTMGSTGALALLAPPPPLLLLELVVVVVVVAAVVVVVGGVGDVGVVGALFGAGVGAGTGWGVRLLKVAAGVTLVLVTEGSAVVSVSRKSPEAPVPERLVATAAAKYEGVEAMEVTALKGVTTLNDTAQSKVDKRRWATPPPPPSPPPVASS